MAISSILPTTISLPSTRLPNPPTPISSLRVLSPSTTHLTLYSSSSSSSSSSSYPSPSSSAAAAAVTAGRWRRCGWEGAADVPGRGLEVAVEADAGEEGEAAPQGPPLPRAPDLRDAEARGAPRRRGAAREAVGGAAAGAGAGGDAVLGERRRAGEGARRPVPPPRGFDAWNDRDGPQIFQKLPPTTDDGDLPSARFFPKGAVHSVKPYGITDSKEEDGEVDLERGGDDLRFGIGGRQRRRRRRSVRSSGEPPIDAEITDSTRERDSFRLDSGDDSLIRNGDQMRRGVDGRANRNSRWRSSLRPTADISNLSINEDSNGKSDRRWSRYSSSNDRISGGRIGDL
uniref:Uncharacterized protein n=1 Tax=Ananas comosus var. bracteatus TaxID=296719 RepID=A0A6V7P111_ANACO|nr:unnamed protein product [Ananas comosus var. bracteatus]